MPIANVEENNRTRDRLIAQLRRGRLIGCTGAGVSVWAGYHPWRIVIQRLAAEVDRIRPGEVNTQLIVQNYASDLLLCAQRLGANLGQGSFSRFILAEFGPNGAPVHDVLLRIAGLPLRHVLTFNFDVSYQSALSLVGSECQTIASTNRRALAAFLREIDDPSYPRHVIHLHGKFDDQVALTEDGYTALYRDALFKNFVWTMASKRLFFMGFSFTDMDFTNIMRDCARDTRENGLSHFALVGLKPNENDNERRALFNERFLIDPLFYQVTHHADGQENHEEFVGMINGITTSLGMAEPIATQRPLVVTATPASALDPADELRAEELNRRLLDRIDRGGGGD